MPFLTSVRTVRFVLCLPWCSRFGRHGGRLTHSTQWKARESATTRSVTCTAINPSTTFEDTPIISSCLPGMSTSFKRVISHEELGSSSKKIMSAEAEKEGGEELKMPPIADTVEAPLLPAAVVIEQENTDETHKEDSDHVAAAAASFRGVSTLSEDKSLYETVEEADALSGISRNEMNLARLDSRASDVMQRTQRTGSGSSGTFGWFIDVHGGDGGMPKVKEQDGRKQGDSKKEEDESGEELTQFVDISQQNVESEAPLSSAMAVTAPNYIFEQTLSDQMLWKQHAGNRPPQPEEERAYFEMLWRQNFALSNVQYDFDLETLNEGTMDEAYATDGMQNYSSYNLATDFMATDAEVAEAIERLHGGAVNMGSTVENVGERTKPKVINKTVKGTGSNEDLTVLIKGDNVFGTTVSKSFARETSNGTREVDTVNISVASYRVVESKKHGKYAQFLVIYREGGIRDTIGVWKRYSDFEALSRKVVESQDSCSSVLANMSPLAVTEEGDVEHLPNAITSWRLLKKRQRWFRCLDAGYLSLKVFLLERFLHDILFESSSPNLLRDFVIYDKSGAK